MKYLSLLLIFVAFLAFANCKSDPKEGEQTTDTVKTGLNNETNINNEQLKIYKDSLDAVKQKLSESEKTMAESNSIIERLKLQYANLQKTKTTKETNTQSQTVVMNNTKDKTSKQPDVKTITNGEFNTVEEVVTSYNQKKSRIEQLNNEINELKNKNTGSDEKMKSLIAEKEKLEKEVQQMTGYVQQIRISDARVTFFYKGIKKVIGNIEIIDICYVINENETAISGDKVLYVCITDPNGNVIPNTGLKTFTAKDKQKLLTYAACDTFKYNNKEKAINCLEFKRGTNNLVTGEYKLDFYVDGDFSGTGVFNIVK